ncbi:hypothetical protein ACHHYP_16626 [Achlya hypogyna]|uniref:F-box domain-containing protein n=1 Tax=Achlya hypogyna TaxID=1202772 RepID=A0A1V9Y6A4_ACHHY|nr:hypothetical protein ACHHYP_16626 [Achlya hypogyna]
MRRILSSQSRGRIDSQGAAHDTSVAEDAASNVPSQVAPESPTRSTASVRNIGSFFKSSSSPEKAKDAVAPDEQSSKKKKGFGFGGFSPKFSLSNFNPLKRNAKKNGPAKGVAPPPPDRPIAKLFAAKYHGHLRLICSYLPFTALGRLAQVSEAMQDFALEVFQSPEYMAPYKDSIPTSYYLYQTLLRDHLLSRNRRAIDWDIPVAVLDYLTLPERLTMTCVCRRFVGIVSSMDLRLWGQRQGYKFLQSYDIESKAFWLVRHRYARTRSVTLRAFILNQLVHKLLLFIDYMTSPQVEVFLSAVGHGCFPKLTAFCVSHVHFTEPPLHLSKQLVAAFDQSGLLSKVNNLSLQGWSFPMFQITFQSVQVLTGDWKGTQLTAESFSLLSNALGGQLFHFKSAQLYNSMPGHALRHLNVSGNTIGAGAAALWAAMSDRAFVQLETLIMSYAGLALQEFNGLAQMLRKADSCPALRHLDLGGNAPKSTGIIRFAQFFQSSAATRLRHLDLSYNGVDSATIDRLVDAIEAHACPGLQHLNVARNLPLQSTTIAHLNQMVRGPSCPSLRCLQMGDAATPDAGVALVKQIRSHQSPVALERQRETLRSAKREAFERKSHEAAIATEERTKEKCAIRRALYDRLEAEAAQANLVKSPTKRKTKLVQDLPIYRKMHEEILAALGTGLN